MSEDLEREIRSVRRQYSALSSPVRANERIDPSSEPIGLRLGSIAEFVFPHEGILDAILNFAQSVWHFKDYLKDALSSEKDRSAVEQFADQSRDLKLCADLANKKKHARLDRPRSGESPELGKLTENGAMAGVVAFDTKACGMFEFAYNGKNKSHRIWTEHDAPIAVAVDLLVSTPTSVRSEGDAVAFIYAAFRQWFTLIESLGISVRSSAIE